MKNLRKNNPAERLQPDEIHLWFSFPEKIQGDALLAEYQQLMTPDERKRHQRFHFAKHRHQFLISRALVRTTLSRCTGIAPEHLRFSENDYGRPEIILDEQLPPIRFNLSHTEGLIVCAVVLKHDIGVDVEHRQRRVVSEKIAKRFFSSTEVGELESLPEQNKRDRFFKYWTLKESYIKARGMGLSIPLDKFSFHLANNKPIRISFDPELEDDPNRWQFRLLNPTPVHQTALSIHQESRTSCPLTIKRVVPLIEEENFHCPVAECSV
jgi:4'-phosphopantetheinyl transferase